MRPAGRFPLIGIIGPNASLCPPALYHFGEALGRRLARYPVGIVCGGMGGFMEAVCKGVKSAPHAFSGPTVGILPSETPQDANPYIDIVIPTGMGTARNVLIVNSAALLIAAGGGAGTLSEIAFAWQRRKTVLCVQGFGGWAEQTAGRQLDSRADGLLIPVSSIEAIDTYIQQFLQDRTH